MSVDRPVQVFDDPQPEVSGATTGGLATRFVGSATRPAEPRPAPAPEASAGGPEEAAARLGDGTKLLRIGMVASSVGLCLLMFVGYVYFFSNLQEHREQHALLNVYTTADKAQILSAKQLPQGAPAAVLTIPAIGLSQVVVEGSNATDLLKGPGLMPGTARPGSLGNAVIAGHRTIAGSPFTHLSDLRPGDRIGVVTVTGAYRYRVLDVGSARPGEQDPISPSRHPRLTLVTSGGTAASLGRTYVVAALVSRPNRLPIPRVPPTAAERGLSGDPAGVLPSVLWGLALAGALAVTFWAYWRFRGRQWSVYVLSTPVLLAVAFVWCENLIRLLPGTM